MHHNNKINSENTYTIIKNLKALLGDNGYDLNNIYIIESLAEISKGISRLLLLASLIKIDPKKLLSKLTDNLN